MAASSVLDLIFRTRKTGTGVKETRDDLGQLNSMLGKLGLGAISATAAIAAVHRSFDMAEEGAQILRLRTAGDALAESFGASMDDVVEAIQEGARGGISEMDALAAANRAMTLGVGQDAETLGQLMEVAAARGRIMGLETTQAFNDIVTGVGRMSPMILDNLGILTTDLPAGLTGAARKAALLEMVLEDGAAQIEAMGGLVPDAASAFEHLGAASADAGDRLKAALGEAFAPFVEFLAHTIEVESDYADQTDEVDRIMEELGLTHGRAGSFVNEYGQVVARGREQLLEYAEAQRVAAQFLMDEHMPAVEAAREAHLRASDAVRAHADALGSVAEHARDTRGAFDEANSGLVNMIDSWREKMEWIAGGGLELQAAAEDVMAAFQRGALTQEQADALLEPIEAAALGLQEEIGQISISDAQQRLVGDYGLGWGEARDAIAAARENIENLPAEVQSQIRVAVQWYIAGRGFWEGPEPGGQHGLNMIVPPGFPGDTFPVRATSGERVIVQTQEQQQRSGGGGISIGQLIVNTELDEQILLSKFRRLLT